MEHQKLSFGKVKDYWELRLPQTWYSNKKPLTKEWFNEIECKRYNVYYNYLYDVAEFKYHPGEKVLEIGVGVGTDLIQFAKNGSKVYGIDLTYNAIMITKKNFKYSNLRFERLLTSNGEELSFKSEMFDLVFCFGVIHHTKNAKKMLKEIYRVLKPEGKAIIMVYAFGWKHFIKRILIKGILCGELFRLSYQSLINKNTEVEGNSLLTRIYTKKKIKRLCRGLGIFSIERFRLGEYFDYRPYDSWKFPKMVTSMLYFLGLEKMLGENWIIKIIKTKGRKRLSFWKTLLKP